MGFNSAFKGLNVPSLFINFAFHNKPRICILVRTAPEYFERRLRLKCDGTIAETRFRLSAKRTSPFKSAGNQFSLLLAGELCTSACRVCTARVQACVLQSCDVYWLPTAFSCFPFTSPPVRHRVPSHFNWTLLNYETFL